MKLLLLRELREGWRSFRLPGVALLALFFALLEPPSQKYMDQILGKFAEGVTIIMPPATAESAFIAFAGDLSSIVLIAVIIVTMGIVAHERHNGLTEWFLTRPVSRNAYILAKAVYLVITTLIIVSASSLVCALYTYTLMGALNITGVFYAIILVTTQILLPLTVTFTVSALTGVAGAAAGAGIITVFITSTLSFLLSSARVDWLPIQLTSHLPQVLTGTASSSFWIAVASGWLVIAVLFWISQLHFTRQQL